VQFTPDLMPSDILGSEVLEESADGKRAFRFIKGPVFCQLLMADEINRASPRTQSALLQAMQEHKVAGGRRAHLPARPFHVLATQNPIEQEGTYPLPEAQLDRFLLEIDVAYPDASRRAPMLLATTGASEPSPCGDDGGADVGAGARPPPSRWASRCVDAILEAGPRRAARRRVAGAVRNKLAWGPGPRASPGADAGHPRPRRARWPPRALRIDDVLALAEPCCATAWRSTSPRAPMACSSPMSSGH
jgi:MoxR-like ATPase